MKKVKFSWAYLLVLTLAIVCLFLLFTDTNVSGKKTTPDVAITMIQEDKVSDFYAKDGIAKIKLFDSQIKNFPTTADYYFKYTQDTISRVIDAIENQNTANASDPDKHISWNYEPTEPSFFERIMPILYIGFGLFIIFLIYKMISSSNKGAMTFGKSRARQTAMCLALRRAMVI